MIRLSERGEVRLGFRCNARCGFCYYQDLVDNPPDKEPTTEQLQKQLQALRRLGATEIEFTGGEPTIRHDLVQLTVYAKKLGFVNVSLITNGLRLANEQFARALVAAGLNDVLFSIHGHTGELHDAHTGIRGSFAQIMRGVRNIQALGVRCRSSTTVTAQNYMHIEEIVGMLLGLSMQTIHLAVFSPVAQASGNEAELAVRYSDAGTYIKRAIDRYRSQLPPLSVKYIPFCFMKGYEQYVMNLYQQSFDPDDWNYYFSNRVRRAHSPFRAILFDFAVLAGFLAVKRWAVPARYGIRGMRVFGLTRIVELMRKKRPAVCRKCAFDVVCDHVWRSYAARFGVSELSPVAGSKIEHPAWSYVLARSRSPGSSLSGLSRSSCAQVPVVQSSHAADK
jgi:MoaA/NifB/PqqE/SkfB family radical SAM enzyme